TLPREQWMSRRSAGRRTEPPPGLRPRTRRSSPMPVSPGAEAISMDSRNSATLLSLPRFDRRLQRSELPRPEIIQIRAHRRQALGIDREQMPGPLPRADREPGLAEHSEMVRGRLLREAQLP